LRRTHPDGLRLYLLTKHYRRPFDHDVRRMAEGDALAAAIRRVAERSGTRAWSAPIPRAALRMLDGGAGSSPGLSRLAVLGAGPAALVLHYNDRGVDKRPVFNTCQKDLTRVAKLIAPPLALGMLATACRARFAMANFP
jgi:hypothetical protein